VRTGRKKQENTSLDRAFASYAFSISFHHFKAYTLNEVVYNIHIQINENDCTQLWATTRLWAIAAGKQQK